MNSVLAGVGKATNNPHPHPSTDPSSKASDHLSAAVLIPRGSSSQARLMSDFGFRQPGPLDLNLIQSPDATESVFPFEIWTLVDRYIPWKTRLVLSSTCKPLRRLLPPRYECITLTLIDSPMDLEDHANQRLLNKISFLTSPKIALTVKFCRLSFHTKRVPSLPTSVDLCTPLFSALGQFENLTDLDCFRILFNDHHVCIINSLPHLIRAEFTECQWMHMRHIPFENRMRLRHLLVDHGPNKYRYNWLFNTHPNHLISLVLTSGMPADFVSGFLPPLPNLESLEINGIAIFHPEFPEFLGLCPGLIELRITTDALQPFYVRAADDVMAVIPENCIPDLRVYEGPEKFLSALARGRLVTHVGVYACPMFTSTFTVSVASALMRYQVRSFKIRVPKVTAQMLALISYFKTALAVEIVVTNEGQPKHSRQTYEDILTALDDSIFPPPPSLEYLSIAEESTIWGVPKESPWYELEHQHESSCLSPASPASLPSASEKDDVKTRRSPYPLPDSPFINKCADLQYVMLSDDSGVIAAWNPRTHSRHVETKTIRQWQRQRLGLFNPVPYDSL